MLRIEHTLKIRGLMMELVPREREDDEEEKEEVVEGWG